MAGMEVKVEEEQLLLDTLIGLWSQYLQASELEDASVKVCVFLLRPLIFPGLIAVCLSCFPIHRTTGFGCCCTTFSFWTIRPWKMPGLIGNVIRKRSLGYRCCEKLNGYL